MRAGAVLLYRAGLSCITTLHFVNRNLKLFHISEKTTLYAKISDNHFGFCAIIETQIDPFPIVGGLTKMKLKYAFQRGVASALIAGVVLTAGLPALAAGGAEAAETESAAVVQVVSPSDEGTAQDEFGVSAAMNISEDETPLSIEDETPLSGNAGTGFWSTLFQLLKHLAGKH